MRILFCPAIIFTLLGCSITPNENITSKDGLFYEANSNKLFNGKVTLPAGVFEGIEGHSKGKIKDGKRIGLWTHFYPNGKLAKTSNWKNNLQDGLATYWYKNGKKEYEIYYKAGKQHGLATIWYENGQKKIESNWKDGEPDGLVTQWYENGQKKREVEITHERVAGTAWYKNGQKKSESNHKDDKLESVTVWKPNGEKCAVTNFIDGNGVRVWYEEDGSESFRLNYKVSKPVRD